MNNILQLLDITRQVTENVFPSEKQETKFDKFIDLVKDLASGGPWGVLGQAIETTGKVLNTICSGKQQVQAVKYVADAYEAKCRAEAEIARISEMAKMRQSRDALMTIYIDRAFQTEMDAIGKKILLESHQLDLRHEEEMEKIRAQREIAIRHIDEVARCKLHGIDQAYAETIRRNEMYCLLYRQYLKYLNDTDITPGAMIFEICKRQMDILEKAVFHPTANMQVLSMSMDSTKQLLSFLGNPDSYFISFDQFVSQKRQIEEW